MIGLSYYKYVTKLVKKIKLNTTRILRMLVVFNIILFTRFVTLTYFFSRIIAGDVSDPGHFGPKHSDISDPIFRTYGTHSLRFGPVCKSFRTSKYPVLYTVCLFVYFGKNQHIAYNDTKLYETAH